MPLTHVAVEHEFGVALDELGLNIIAAALRRLRPDLFIKSTDIVVKPAEAGPPPQPAHVLTLYVIANGSPTFNLYPVDNAPTLPQDSFFVQIAISFSLTDSVLGTITRIGAVIDAAGTIVLDAHGNMILRLGTKPDGTEYLDVVDLTGQQPDPPTKLIDGQLDAGAGLQRVYNADDDSPLGRTFRAIVNYLINLYLKTGLRRTVVEFPVPPLNNLVQLGPLGYLPIDRIYVRNKSVYATLGARDGGPAPFPLAPPKPADIRFGAAQAGITRLINSLLPIHIQDASTGNDHTVLQFWSQGLEVSDIGVRLLPGQDPPFGLRVGISGTLGFTINLDCGPFGWLHLPIPFPLDPLTGYWGKATAYLDVQPYNSTTQAGHVAVTVLPDTKFFDAWLVLIVPNYRGLLHDSVKAALDNIADKVLGSKFCQIPILGWILCGVIKVVDVVGPVIGWILGTGLDALVGIWLTTLVSTIGRFVLQFISIKPFQIFSIDQAKIFGIIGTSIASASLEVQQNGRAGELTLNAWFSDQGLPVPAPPVPPTLPQPAAPPPPPLPNLKQLPTYGDAAFAPAAQLSPPAFNDGASMDFTVSINAGGTVSTGSMHATIQLQSNTWYLRVSLLNSRGQNITTSLSEYTFDTGLPVRSETASSLPDGTTLRHVVDYQTAGIVQASIGIDGKPSAQSPVQLTAGATQETRETWMLRLAYSSLSPMSDKIIALVDVADAMQYSNWARQIPMKCSVVGASINWPTAEDPPVEVWSVTANDEGNATELTVNKAGGLLSAKVSNAEHTTIIEITARH